MTAQTSRKSKNRRIGPFLRRVFGRWSFVWVMPERAARVVSWLFVAALIAGTIALWVATRPEHPVDPGRWAAERLASELGLAVTVDSAEGDESGEVHLAGVDVGAGALCAEAATLETFETGLPDRLDLRRGVLTFDVEPVVRGRSALVSRILHEGARLRVVTLRDFAAEVTLGRSDALRLADVEAKAMLSADGSVGATMSGEVASGRLTLGFEQPRAEAAAVLTVSGVGLPWLGRLLSPTLTDDVVSALGPCEGTLELADHSLVTDARDHDWTLDGRARLDATRLAAKAGIGGKVNLEPTVMLEAIGDLEGRATVFAKVTLPDGAAGTITSSALSDLRYLLTGERRAVDVDVVHTVSRVSLLFIVTRDDLRIWSADAGAPGLFTPQGSNLLPLPDADTISLATLRKRLDVLKRR